MTALAPTLTAETPESWLRGARALRRLPRRVRARVIPSASLACDVPEALLGACRTWRGVPLRLCGDRQGGAAQLWFRELSVGHLGELLLRWPALWLPAGSLRLMARLLSRGEPERAAEITALALAATNASRHMAAMAGLRSTRHSRLAAHLAMRLREHGGAALWSSFPVTVGLRDPGGVRVCVQAGGSVIVQQTRPRISAAAPHA